MPINYILTQNFTWSGFGDFHFFVLPAASARGSAPEFAIFNGGICSCYRLRAHGGYTGRFVKFQKSKKKRAFYENGAGGGGTAGSFDLTSLPSLATLTYLACGAKFK